MILYVAIATLQMMQYETDDITGAGNILGLSNTTTNIASSEPNQCTASVSLITFILTPIKLHVGANNFAEVVYSNKTL